MVAGAAFVACETAQRVGGDIAYGLNPVGETELGVQSVDVHGPYLVAQLTGRRDELRAVAPATAPCTTVLRPEARVHYAKSGVFGRVESGDDGCDLVGVASLAAWRDRQPRRHGLVPLATARFDPIYQDDQMVLLRGRFPLAGRVGIPAAYDLVALLPNNAACRAVAAKGEASLEFRPAGSEAFRMMDDDAPCVVAGFAIPLSAP